jgi:hypothetical protein
VAEQNETWSNSDAASATAVPLVKLPPYARAKPLKPPDQIGAESSGLISVVPMGAEEEPLWQPLVALPI